MVDFPAPDGPISATRWPASTVSVRSLTATALSALPYRTVTLRKESTVSAKSSGSAVNFAYLSSDSLDLIVVGAFGIDE